MSAQACWLRHAKGCSWASAHSLPSYSSTLQNRKGGSAQASTQIYAGFSEVCDVLSFTPLDGCMSPNHNLAISMFIKELTNGHFSGSRSVVDSNTYKVNAVRDCIFKSLWLWMIIEHITERAGKGDSRKQVLYLLLNAEWELRFHAVAWVSRAFLLLLPLGCCSEFFLLPQSALTPAYKGAVH